MLSRPTQADGRWQYETGTNRITPNQTTGTQVIPAQAAWDEDGALVQQQPCIMTNIEVVTKETSPTLYVLLFDAIANEANALEVFAGNMGAARYTYGPIAPGGFLVREWQEVFAGRHAPFFVGAPFDRGVLLILSTTPVLFTAGAGSRAHVIARGTCERPCP